MLSMVIEKIKDRDLSLGVIMIIVGVLIWILPIKLAAIGLVVYAVIQTVWKKEETTVEQHHHHHHNNNNNRKKKKVVRNNKNG